MFNLTSKSILFINLFTTLTLSVANANHNKVNLGAISGGGNGCVNGDLNSYIDPITGDLIVEPYDYTAIVENGASFARKSCNISIPFQGIPNRAVRLRQYQIKGAVALDTNSSAEINYEVFYSGQRGDAVTLSFFSNNQIIEKEFDETIPELEIIYSCGKDGIIRSNSSILVKGGTSSSQVALAQIQKFGFKIDTVPCDY